MAVITCGLSVPVPSVTGPTSDHGLLIEPRTVSISGTGGWGGGGPARLVSRDSSVTKGQAALGACPLERALSDTAVAVRAPRAQSSRCLCPPAATSLTGSDGPAGLLVLVVRWDFPSVMGPGYRGVSRLVLLVSWTLVLLFLRLVTDLCVCRRRSTRSV